VHYNHYIFRQTNDSPSASPETVACFSAIRNHSLLQAKLEPLVTLVRQES
jgi:hypothetical protein